MLLICSLSSIGLSGCSSPKPIVVHTPITSKGCPPAFVSEHNDLFAENIRLKQALQICQEKH
jgi:hypothetical protein